MNSLFPIRELAGVNHEGRPIIVEDKNNLQQAPSTSRSPNQQLVVTDPPGIWSGGLDDHILCLFGVDAMACQMLDIPLVPAEVHGLADRYYRTIASFLQ